MTSRLICDRAEFDTLLDRISRAGAVCVDTETTGLYPFKGDKICGVGLSFDEKEAWYLPFRHEGEFYTEGNLDEAWLKELAEALSHVKILIGYNLKFDLKFLFQEGFVLLPHQKLVDVWLMARLVVPDQHPVGGLGLQAMEERFIVRGVGKYNDSLKEWMKKNKLWIDKSKNGDGTYSKVRLFSHVPISKLGPYCCNDVLGTAKVKKVLQRRLVETNQVKVWKNEVESTWDFFRAEIAGVAIDSKYCRQSIKIVVERMDSILKELKQVTGQTFNPNSNGQVTKAMNSVGIISPIMTPGGKSGKKQQAWGKETFKVLGKLHPALGLIREFKCLASLKSTYLEVFLAANGTLHGSFNQAGTITGRVSSVDPNLQNIPVLVQGTLEEGEEVIAHQETLSKMFGPELASNYSIVGKSYTADEWDPGDGTMVAARRAIVPRKGKVFLKADYDQMEMIVFVCYMNNRELLNQIEQSYRDGIPMDFHNLIAKLVWNLEPGDEGFTKARQLAKILNFSIIYGAGIKKVASQLEVSLDQAKVFRSQYFDRLKGAEAFVNRVHETIEARGWVKNSYGRRYVLDETLSYKAVNYLIQGSCADFIKERMFKLRDLMLETDSCIVLQVHDELVIEVPEDRAEEIGERVRTILEEKVFSIPLPCSISICRDSWIVGDKLVKETVAA